MEIKEFIVETISQILDSVEEINSTYQDKGVKVADIGKNNYKGSWKSEYITDVDFDIAVDVLMDKETGKGARLGVASFVNGGLDSTEKKQNQITNRVHFTLPVKFPAKAE